MIRKISFLSVVAIILSVSSILYAFGELETGTLRGRVIDGFGNPVSFTTILVTTGTTQSRIVSDSKGSFSFKYQPGNIALTFEKEGFVSTYIPLLFEEKADLSIGDIILWNIPPKGGIFAVGDNRYIPINRAKYYSEMREKERFFYVKGTPTKVKGRKLTLIDFQTDNPLVVGKTLYRVDSNSSLGSIKFHPFQKYELYKVGDTYIKIADNVGKREIELPPGKYFYCTGEITIRSKTGSGFFFEITS